MWTWPWLVLVYPLFWIRPTRTWASALPCRSPRARRLQPQRNGDAVLARNERLQRRQGALSRASRLEPAAVGAFSAQAEGADAPRRSLSPMKRPERRSDRRYSTRRWTELARVVRRRDLWACYAPGCPRGAQVTDHIIPSTPEMPDWQFYDESNLRGACRLHNNLRGLQTLAEREAGPTPKQKGRTPYV
jgi:hypothetical protein